MRIDNSAPVLTLAASHEAPTSPSGEESLSAWPGEAERTAAVPTDVAQISPDARSLQAEQVGDEELEDVASPKDEAELLMLSRVMAALTGRRWDVAELKKLRDYLKKISHPQITEAPQKSEHTPGRTPAVVYQFPVRSKDAGPAGVSGDDADGAGEDPGTADAAQTNAVGDDAPATGVPNTHEPGQPADAVRVVHAYAGGEATGTTGKVDVKV